MVNFNKRLKRYFSTVLLLAFIFGIGFNFSTNFQVKNAKAVSDPGDGGGGGGGGGLPTPAAHILANGTAGSISVSPGSNVSLTWTSSNVTACVVNPGGFTGTSGSQSVTVNSTISYSIVCDNGEASSNVLVSIASGGANGDPFPNAQLLVGDSRDVHPGVPPACGNNSSRPNIGWGTDVDNAGNDADCLKTRITNQSYAFTEDFQYCFSLNSTTRCTPWASQGGGSTGIVVSGDSFNYAGIHVNHRPSPTPGMYYTNVRVGVQLFYRSNGSACGPSSGIGFASGVPGQASESPWVWGASHDNDPGCGAFYLEASANLPNDAAFIEPRDPINAEQNSSKSFNIVMKNLGATWDLDQSSQVSGDCSGFNPTEAGQTCVEVKEYKSSNYKLVRQDSVSEITAPAQIDLKKQITFTYTSYEYQWCEIDPPPSGGGGGIEPILNLKKDEKHFSFSEFFHTLIKKVSAQTETCTTNIGVQTTVSENPYVLYNSQANFPITINTTQSGTYNLKYRMKQLTASSYGNPAGEFGEMANIQVVVGNGGSPDFNLIVTPPNNEVFQGDVAIYDFSATCSNFSGPITNLAVRGQQAGTVVGFTDSNGNSISSIACGASGKIQISTSCNTDVSVLTKTLALSGFGEGVGTKDAERSFNLTIRAGRCLESISLLPADAVIKLSGSPNTQVYTVTANYADGTQQDVTSNSTYSTNPAGIATMNQNIATAQALGDTVVNASYSENGINKNASGNLHVISAACQVQFDSNSPTATDVESLITINGFSGSPSSKAFAADSPTQWSVSGALTIDSSGPNWVRVKGKVPQDGVTYSGSVNANNVTAGDGTTGCSVSTSINVRDFTLNTPENVTVEKGTPANVFLNLGKINNFSKQLNLTQNGAPAAASFVPTSGTPNFSSTLTLETAGASVGDYQVTIKSTNATNNSHFKQAQFTLSIIPVIDPGNSPDVTFTIDGSSSTTIEAGNSATLQWQPTNTANGNSCTAGGDWNGQVSGTPGQSYTQSTGNKVVGNYSYTIYCANDQGDVSATKTVTLNVVTALPRASINCNGSTGRCDINSGDSANIAWTSSGVTSCQVSPNGWIGVSGTQPTGPLNSDVTYQVSCTGPNGPAQASVLVHVGSTSGDGDFTTACTPLTQTIAAGGIVSYTLSTTSVNGFNSPVHFTASIDPTNPNGPTINFSGNDQVPPAATTAVISTTSSTQLGTYTITFSGSGNGLNHSCQSQIVVTGGPSSGPDFALVLTPQNQTVDTGQQAIYDLYADCYGSFAGPVTALNVSGLHNGASYQFLEYLNGPLVTQIALCGQNNGVKLVIDTGSVSDSTSTRTITISGQGQNVGQRTITSALTINPLSGSNNYNLSASDKDILKVNGANNTGISSCSGAGNADSINSQFGLIKKGDIITFKINMCNSGGVDAKVTKIVDTLTNLIKPNSGWNAQYTDSSGTQNIPASNIVDVKNSSGVVTGLTFDFTASPKTIPHRTVSSGNIAYGITSITFNAQIKSSSTSQNSIYRFQNRAKIYERDGSIVDVSTPLLLFSNGTGNPDLKEIAP